MIILFVFFFPHSQVLRLFSAASQPLVSAADLSEQIEALEIQYLLEQGGMPTRYMNTCTITHVT